MINKNRIIVSSFTFLATILILLSFSLSGNAQTLYSCQARSTGDTNPFLHTIDPNTGATLTTVEILLAGETVRGCNGLAKDPTTDTCWMIVNVQGAGRTIPPSSRILAIIDVGTGIATEIGNTGDAFASITFDSNGTLYGVTGDGASTSETLFTLNKFNGTPTFVQTLGNGDAGEAIGFNPNDGLLYHASGEGTLNTLNIFESINPNNNVVTPITISGDTSQWGEQTALVHLSGDVFCAADLGISGTDLNSITTSGVVSFIGDMDHRSKGLAFDCGIPIIPTPPPIPTLSQLGLLSLAVVLGILGIAGFLVMRRRKATV